MHLYFERKKKHASELHTQIVQRDTVHLVNIYADFICVPFEQSKINPGSGESCDFPAFAFIIEG